MGRKEGNPIHNLRYTAEYCSWQHMKQRCNNKDNKSYPDYGARGITVCDRWLESVVNFVEDMGLKPTGDHVIDRIDNEKGYFKENCRWVLQCVNNRNSRQSKVWVLDGVEYGSSALAASALGVSRAVIRDRCLGRSGTRKIRRKEGCYTKMLYENLNTGG